MCKNPNGPPHNPRWKSNEERNITENGQNYTCTMDGEPIKKKRCSTGCEYNGKTLCCKIEDITYKQRAFTCVPDDESAPSIPKTFTVREEKRCVCYHCSDVCPKPTPASTTMATTTEYSSGEETTTEKPDIDNNTLNSAEAIETNSSL